jgi:hypothetical protein
MDADTIDRVIRRCIRKNRKNTKDEFIVTLTLLVDYQIEANVAEEDEMGDDDLYTYDEYTSVTTDDIVQWGNEAILHRITEDAISKPTFTSLHNYFQITVNFSSSYPKHINIGFILTEIESPDGECNYPIVKTIHEKTREFYPVGKVLRVFCHKV